MPDGKPPVVAIGGKIHHVDLQTGKSAIVPFTAKVQAEIGPRLSFQNRVDDSPVVRARLIRWPALAPDGKRVAFSALNNLWIKDLPDGTPKRLTNSAVGEFMPAWSPDGRYLAYVTWSRDGGQIFRVAADGNSAPEQLTRRPAFYSYPVYSPDGSKIVFVSGASADQLFADVRDSEPASVYPEDPQKSLGEITGIPGGTGLDLRWIPAAGGDSTLIGPTQGGRFPHFTNDPGRIYMTASFTGLVSLRLDGLDRRTHFKVTGAAPGPYPPPAEEMSKYNHSHLALLNLHN